MTAIEELVSREADQETSMEGLVHYGSEVEVSDRANSWPCIDSFKATEDQDRMETGKPEEFLLRISIIASPREIILIPVVL